MNMQSRRYNSGAVSQVGGALTYPIIMMCVGAGIMAFLVAYVVPQVATIFEQQHAALPFSTRLLIRFSALVTRHWLAETMLSVWLAAGIAGALATPRGQRLYHYYERLGQSRRVTSVLEPVMTIAVAAVIVFMMLAVLMPIFQLNQLMQ
jgi:type II secretory pathway component PulF